MRLLNRCECGEVYDARCPGSLQWAPCSGCGEVVKCVDNAIAEAQECQTLSQVADAFANVERHDCIVREVFIMPQAFFDIRKDKSNPMDIEGHGNSLQIVGKHGETNAFLWNAKVVFHAPPGKMMIWNEKQVFD